MRALRQCAPRRERCDGALKCAIATTNIAYAMLSNLGLPGSRPSPRSHKTKGPARAGPLFLWLGD